MLLPLLDGTLAQPDIPLDEELLSELLRLVEGALEINLRAAAHPISHGLGGHEPLLDLELDELVVALVLELLGCVDVLALCLQSKLALLIDVDLISLRVLDTPGCPGACALFLTGKGEGCVVAFCSRLLLCGIDHDRVLRQQACLQVRR